MPYSLASASAVTVTQVPGQESTGTLLPASPEAYDRACSKLLPLPLVVGREPENCSAEVCVSERQHGVMTFVHG